MQDEATTQSAIAFSIPGVVLGLIPRFSALV
jgi:hypothetical protein